MAQLRKLGGANRRFYQAIMQQFGFDSDATRVTAVCKPFTANSGCDDYLYNNAAWRYTFILRLPAERRAMTCNGTCNDNIVNYQSEAVLDTFNRAKPLHTVILFIFY